MIRRLIGISLSLRFLMVVLAVALMVFGVTQARSMPVDVYPEFNPPLVEIQTEALGLSAAEIESLITVPMEADLLNGVAWLDKIYSESVAGLSSILLVFEPGTDPVRARQMVQERLNQTYALPNVSSPPTMLQPLSTTGRAMMIGLSSDKLSLIEMGVLARWKIVPRLTGVTGVSNVAIWGQRERQLQVQVDPARLYASGVKLNQVIETTGEALWVSPLSYLESSSPGTAGWIDTPNQRLSIRHELPIASPQDLARVSVAGADGLLLGDIATVVEDHQPLIGDAVLNQGPGLLLVVEKFPGANTLQVTRGVEAALEAMSPGLSGIKVDATIFRPAGYIEQSIGNISTMLIIAAILMFLVLAAFLFGWRTTLISLVVIPFAMISAVFVLYLRGQTFNLMILAGLAVALVIIIDDVILQVERYARRLAQQKREHDKAVPDRTAEILLNASAEIYGPIGFATLIILLLLAPLFAMSGLTGAFFQPFVISFGLAVLVSLLASLLLTPALSLLLLSNGAIQPEETPFTAWLQRGYHQFLARTIHKTDLAYTLVATLTIALLVMVPFLKISLMPQLKQTDLLIKWQSVPGTSRVEMDRIMGLAIAELRSIAGVRNVGSHVGRAVTGDAVVGINSGELWVSISPSASYEATTAAIREVVDGYPGLFHQMQTYQPDRIGEVLASSEQNLVVRVYGSELDVLRSKTQEVIQAVSGIPGVASAQANMFEEEPQVVIKVDLAAAERYHVKPGDVRRAATTLLSGLRVGNLYEGQKVFDVVVWSVPQIRSSLTGLRDLLIDTPTGQVRLSNVADVSIRPSPVIIRRESVSRYMDVNVMVSGRDFNAVAANVSNSIKSIPFPLEHHAEVLGNLAEQRAAQQRLIVFALAALIGCFLLLQAAFHSWRLAFVAFATVPAALAGGVLGALLSGGLSLGSAFGFLAVSAILVRNGVMAISHLNTLEVREGRPFSAELVLRGAGERLKPALMTTLTGAAAMLPFVAAGDLAGLEILRPMAAVILGGLVTTALLTLFALPLLYLRFGAAREADIQSELALSPAGD